MIVPQSSSTSLRHPSPVSTYSVRADPLPRRPRTPVDHLLAATAALSVVGGVRFGPVSLDAAASTLLAGSFAAASLRRRTILPPYVAACTAPLVAVLLLMTAATVGADITISGAQQAVVWLGTALAIIYAFNATRNIDKAELSGRVTSSMQSVTVVIIAVTFFSKFVISVPGVSPRVAALGALVPLVWFVSISTSNRSAPARYAASICVFDVLTLSRTAAAVAILILLLGRPTRRRFKSLRLATRLAAFVGLGLVLVRYWKPLRDRFFTGDLSLSLGGVDINASGRGTLWRGIWRGVGEAPLTGHGLGTVRARTQQIAPGLGHPHQEILRLLYEGGFLCLAIFVVWVLVIWTAVSRASRQTETTGRHLPHVAKLMLGVVLLTSMTDNTLVYPFLMLPFGLFVGMALSTRRRPAS